MSRRIVAFLLVLALATLARAAGAEVLPLSAIPLASSVLSKVSETARIEGVRKVGDTFVSALDKPVCLSLFDPTVEDYQATGAVVYWTGDPQVLELEILRLETDGEPYLDRTVIDHGTDLDHATILRHARIPLIRIVAGAVPAYAYRTNSKLHVFVRQGFGLPLDAFDGRLANRQGCGFTLQTLLLRGEVSSSSVQAPHAMKDSERWLDDISEAFHLLETRFPKGRPPPPTYSVNVSVSQVSRDPEPLVSVVVVAPQKAAAP